VSVTPLLEARGIDKRFGPVQVLKDVDFAVTPGEVTALVGDNGAGKSTLVKCISGIYPIDAGEFLFDGQPVTIHGPRDAAGLGIEVVYQDLALCDNLDIVQNMFLGRERRSGLVLDEPTMEQMAAETLAGCRCAPSSRCASTSPASPAGSGRPSRSPRRCCGTARW
jgi:D-xylose transport system ATP-binding protein